LTNPPKSSNSINAPRTSLNKTPSSPKVSSAKIPNKTISAPIKKESKLPESNKSIGGSSNNSNKPPPKPQQNQKVPVKKAAEVKKP
jgi:hypothetical protein